MTGPIYVHEIIKAATNSDKPVLAEAPFSISQTKDPLEAHGIKVIPVFIAEDPEVITERYKNREKKPIPKGHLTRQQTYAQRAKQWKAFSGTSGEVLEHLKKVAQA
jgi:polyphosphate kinase 2 (PPK2 family)